LNKARLTKVLQITKQMSEQIEVWRSQLESIKDTEDEARENTPESLQETDRFAVSEEASECMDDAFEHLGDAIECLSEIG
jgi:hypothetical protein